MSDRDGEELELEALQRQLDDAFETTRPRRGFEDELWLRIQRRRPFGERLRDVLGGLLGGFREAPAIPLAAVALLLIVVVGVGVLNSGLSPFGAKHESLSAGAPNSDRGSAGGAYLAGTIPTPALHPGLVDTASTNVGSTSAPAVAAESNLYYGPANLVWGGTFPADSVSAPVLIYTEPTPNQAKTDTGVFGPPQGVTIQTRPGVAQLPREPIFIATETGAGVSPGTDPVAAADSFLSAHGLVPPWPNNVFVIQSNGVARVIYQRGFSLPSSDVAYLVNWNGDRYGLEVDIVNGKRTAAGPLPLGLQSVSLPLISNSDAAHLAVSEPPASTQSFSATPTVNLDTVELVYALAISGQNGFYEPAYLFSGTFTYNGQTYVKRVLVPLVVASLRS